MHLVTIQFAAGPGWGTIARTFETARDARWYWTCQRDRDSERRVTTLYTVNKGK